MTTVEHPSGRRDLSVLFVVMGIACLAVALPLGPRGILAGIVGAGALLLVALLETRRAVVTWPNAIGLLVGVVWLIPIKGYALPVDLPFNVEHYRLAILALALALLVGILTRTQELSLAGRAVPVALLVGGATVAFIANAGAIDEASAESGAGLKALSYFLSFFVVFVLVASVIRTRAQIDTVFRAIVLGAVLVAFGALHEARSGYNVFDHLHQWLPGFERQLRDVSEARGGRLRVYASAQHPIALSVALTTVIPLAVYLSTRARAGVRSHFWLGAAGVIGVAASATISRTFVVMAAVMLALGLVLRRQQVARYWPVLIVLPFVIHTAAPGAMGGVYKAFFPEEGLVSDLSGRAGEGGSGRFADLRPGLTLWANRPIVGNGLGNTFPSTDASQSPGQAPLPLIFDNQYVDTLVKQGIVGLVGTILFFWGAGIAFFRGARRQRGPDSDLLVACAVSTIGFATAMFLFDAYAFVQATLLCVVVVAAGYRCLKLTQTVRGLPTSKGELT